MFKPGQIFFTTENDLISNYIRWFEQRTNPLAEWTHCGIIISEDMVNTLDCHPIAQIVEATWPCVAKNTTDDYRDIKSKTIILEHPTPDLISLNEIMNQYLGKKYGLIQLFGRAIYKLFKVEIHPLFKGIVCCEFVLDWLKKWVPAAAYIDQDIMDVQQLYNLCIQSGFVVKYLCDYGTETFKEVKE